MKGTTLGTEGESSRKPYDKYFRSEHGMTLHATCKRYVHVASLFVFVNGFIYTGKLCTACPVLIYVKLYLNFIILS